MMSGSGPEHDSDAPGLMGWLLGGILAGMLAAAASPSQPTPDALPSMPSRSSDPGSAELERACRTLIASPDGLVGAAEPAFLERITATSLTQDEELPARFGRILELHHRSMQASPERDREPLPLALRLALLEFGEIQHAIRALNRQRMHSSSLEDVASRAWIGAQAMHLDSVGRRAMERSLDTWRPAPVQILELASYLPRACWQARRQQLLSGAISHLTDPDPVLRERVTVALLEIMKGAVALESGPDDPWAVARRELEEHWSGCGRSRAASGCDRHTAEVTRLLERAAAHPAAAPETSSVTGVRGAPLPEG